MLRKSTSDILPNFSFNLLNANENKDLLSCNDLIKKFNSTNLFSDKLKFFCSLVIKIQSLPNFHFTNWFNQNNPFEIVKKINLHQFYLTLFNASSFDDQSANHITNKINELIILINAIKKLNTNLSLQTFRFINILKQFTQIEEQVNWVNLNENLLTTLTDLRATIFVDLQNLIQSIKDNSKEELTVLLTCLLNETSQFFLCNSSYKLNFSHINLDRINQLSPGLLSIIHSISAADTEALVDRKLSSFEDRNFNIKCLGGKIAVFEIDMNVEKLILKVHPNDIDPNFYTDTLRGIYTAREKLGLETEKILCDYYYFKKIYFKDKEIATLELKEHLPFSTLAYRPKVRKGCQLEKEILFQILIYSASMIKIMIMLQKKKILFPDIKPSNFFIAKLVDWDDPNFNFNELLLKISDDKTLRYLEHYPVIPANQTPIISFSPEYLPPEIKEYDLVRRNKIFNANDWHKYSIGLSIYQMLVGVNNYDEKKGADLNQPLFENFSSIKKMLESLLNPDPKKRMELSKALSIVERTIENKKLDQQIFNMFKQHDNPVIKSRKQHSVLFKDSKDTPKTTYNKRNSCPVILGSVEPIETGIIYQKSTSERTLKVNEEIKNESVAAKIQFFNEFNKIKKINCALSYTGKQNTVLNSNYKSKM